MLTGDEQMLFFQLRPFVSAHLAAEASEPAGRESDQRHQPDPNLLVLTEFGQKR